MSDRQVSIKLTQATATFLFFIFLMQALTACAQKGSTVVGIQYKPIFPAAFLGTGKQTSTSNTVSFDVELKSGFCGGMFVRHSFTDLLSFETGINYIKRNYSLSITDSSFKGDSKFRIIGYEIPLSLLAYIQLGEKIYMNASMGPGVDMFASNVQSYDEYFQHVSFRRNLFQMSVLANIGWEYRTEKSGYIYLGASYHRPFSYIFLTKIEYRYRGKDEITSQKLLGNYLTLDLRYIFPENKSKNNRRTN
ncbi:MAG TPA: hypothetical protein PKK99_15230 [Bacteroidia bacterium]|nr:hypothetical protein [Bacteroidia bacterium]HNQ00412.1 hypothetical protein [Bacteroidia bacterium]